MNLLPNKETIPANEDAEATVSGRALAVSSYGNADVVIVEKHCDVVDVEPYGGSRLLKTGVLRPANGPKPRLRPLHVRHP